jgi:hypothetical protein
VIGSNTILQQEQLVQETVVDIKGKEASCTEPINIRYSHKRMSPNMGETEEARGKVSMIGSRRTDVYAVWLAGWLMKKKRRKKKLQKCDTQTLLLGVCLARMLARENKKESAKEKKQCSISCLFCPIHPLCKPPNHQRERIQQGKKKQKTKWRYATDSKSAQTALPKGKL